MPSLRFAAPVEERVALVTGGANGIGRACAVRFAEAGRHVTIADVDVDSSGVNETLSQIESFGRRGLCVAMDVTSEQSVQAGVAQVMENFGRIDILVCAAGVFGREGPFLEQTAEQFDRVMKINVYGAYHAHQAVLPLMIERGWGRCVTFSSGARFGNPNQVPYAVSKAAVHTLVQSLGAAHPRQGVFVNGVEPSRSLTQMVIPRFSAEHLANPGNPIGRYSDPEEVAEVVEFLCSERNTYTSGAIWPVKGG